MKYLEIIFLILFSTSLQASKRPLNTPYFFDIPLEMWKEIYSRLILRDYKDARLVSSTWKNRVDSLTIKVGIGGNQNEDEGKAIESFFSGLKNLKAFKYKEPGRKNEPKINIIPFLTGLKQLRQIDYIGPVTGVSCLSSLSGLEELMLPLWHIKEGDLDCLSLIPHLHSLDIRHGKEESDNALSFLSRLTNLCALNLDGYQVSTVPHIIRGLTSLTGLSLRNNNWVNEQFIRDLAFLTQLKSLDLASIKGVTDDAFRHLSHLTLLEVLTLWQCKNLTPNGIQHLTLFQNLRALNIKRNPHLMGGETKFLSNLRSLTCLRQDLIVYDW